MDISSHNQCQSLTGLAAMGTGAKIKIGCCSWNFRRYAHDAALGALGFDGIELIVLDPDAIEGYWTGATLDRLRGQPERRKPQLTEVMPFHHVTSDLANPHTEARVRPVPSKPAERIAQKPAFGVPSGRGLASPYPHYEGVPHRAKARGLQFTYRNLIPTALSTDNSLKASQSTRKEG